MKALQIGKVSIIKRILRCLVAVLVGPIYLFILFPIFFIILYLFDDDYDTLKHDFKVWKSWIFMQ